MTIEGAIPIPREKGMMSSSRTGSTDQRIYCAARLMYTSKKRPAPHHAIRLKLMRETLKSTSEGEFLSTVTNNRILTGELYKAPKEARKFCVREGFCRDALRQQGLRENSPRNGEPA
jgi:flagellar biosynthesis repressor protein FlbT